MSVRWLSRCKLELNLSAGSGAGYEKYLGPSRLDFPGGPIGHAPSGEPREGDPRGIVPEYPGGSAIENDQLRGMKVIGI